MKTANDNNFKESIGITESGKIKEFPFKTYLSFGPLIEFWEKELFHSNIYKSELVKIALQKVKQVPEFNNLIEDHTILEKHKDIVDLLMAVIYPAAQRDKQISASVAPFSFNTFYKTPLFEKLIPEKGPINIEKVGLDAKAVFLDKVINAYLIILEQLYNTKADIKNPMIVKITNQKNIASYFQLNIDASFVKAVCVDKLPELSEKDIKNLLKDVFNINLWMKALPPEKFEFHGFVTITVINVTEHEAISAIKFDLLENESIMSFERFRDLESKVRSIFMLPDLKIGLAAIPENWNSPTYSGWKIGDSFILNDDCDLECTDFFESIYHKAIKSNKPFIVEDLNEFDDKGKVENAILKLGVRNILVAPLLYKNKLIGALEIGSPNPGDINSLNSQKIKGILPLFAAAVKRYSEDFENQIQKIIKEKCTAIHPSVEWRFRRAAANLVSNKTNNKLAEMEPIVFDNVYPLYGLSDIRNSSEYRNESVKSDMIEHLNLAKGVLQSANQVRKLPLFDEMVFRIEKHIHRVKTGISSGDEVVILEFLQNEIEPVFNHIKDYDSSLNDLIQNYIKTLDPVHKTLYTKRKEYEESVNLINETISNYLDECDEEAQKMYTHYFEKYKTDGVEHGIYIGESLVEESKFDIIYLKNLRLWQLMFMCGVVNKLNELNSKLKMPLETSHLILVQNTPMSIRFRFDEKKFDVDGTYNLRYEIMKKRIDKALIKGTKERLTQPGKIAIVYSNFKEAVEYKRYVEFLESIGNTKCRLEEFELEDLQGMSGLRALRFTVNLDSKALQKKMNVSEIAGTVNSLQEILN
ncbi:MAG TPA: GAF domain-containing protein [Ignavibacteriaceae bacterium]|nr:GAF domain-containing protein [Ignavibacteriaceae bacterium]